MKWWGEQDVSTFRPGYRSTGRRYYWGIRFGKYFRIKDHKEFLAAAEKKGWIYNVSYELPKSFVLCADKEGTKVYITQISSATLRKRAGFMEGIANIGR